MADLPLIHPTALVSAEAQLASDVRIGAHAIVEGPVDLASGCQVAAHAQVLGDVRFGENCRVGRGAIVGEDPQDLSFDPATHSGVRIGRDNTLRELVTIHRSASDGKFTTVGDGNFLMAGVHLGHDVEMGSHNVLANNVLLAGHVTVGSRVFLGGGTGVHQFIRIGDYSLTQGNSSITKDVPPYVIAYQRSLFGGLNVIGLRRAGFSPEVRREIKRALEQLFQLQKPLREAVADVQEEDWGKEARVFIDFIATASRKGVMGCKKR